MNYRSDFKYTPSPNKSPCFSKGTLCQHKQKTIGRCRNYCKEYNDYENAILAAEDKSNEYRIIARYHQNTLEKQRKAKI